MLNDSYFKLNFHLSKVNFKKQKGQFLLEVVIAVAVMLMLTHAFFTLITTSYQILTQSRGQALAKAIANEKMEIIRNLSYDNVGTLGGIPSGDLLQEETIIRNGQYFNVHTTILYKDDPYDGLSPTDTEPADYKLARVEVTWTPAGFPSSQHIVLVSNVAKKGLETLVGGGILQVLVFDSLGAPVPQANVLIEAPSATPPISQSLTTDNFGMVTIPGAQACTSCYSITVTKENYSTDQTHTTTEVANPTKPPLTVIDGQLTQASFTIDKLAQVNFASYNNRSSGFTSKGSLTFHLQSSESIGTDDVGDPVYKTDQDYTTDGGGNASLELETDDYILTLDGVNYDLAGSIPYSPLSVTAGSSLSVQIVAEPHEDHSLLVKVEEVDGTPIPESSIHLYNTGLGYDGTNSGGILNDPDEGQVWFGPLTEDTYTLEITHTGFSDVSTNVDVSGSTVQTIIMNPI